MEVVLFKKFQTNSEPIVANTSGSVANEPIDISLDLKDLNEGYYILEVWADRSGVGDKRLIYPNEEEEFTLKITDRKGV
mgnify:CR=1 FL=1